jgi:pyroglutamyl-peptidase
MAIPSPRRVLVTGFGPFLDVTDNPSGRAARAVDGVVLDGVAIHGMELPVRFLDGPARAIAAARELGATAVIGLGVDRRTRSVDVETRAYNLGAGPDVDGRTVPVLEPGGPQLVHSNLDAVAFAAALGGRVDDDAGRYVCNAWLYLVARALLPATDVVFVHIPAEGIDPARLVAAIGALYGDMARR